MSESVSSELCKAFCILKAVGIEDVEAKMDRSAYLCLLAEMVENGRGPIAMAELIPPPFITFKGRWKIRPTQPPATLEDVHRAVLEAHPDMKFTRRHAEKCPVCDGLGKLNIVSTHNLAGGGKAGCVDETPCHGCHGRGWIVVPEVSSGKDE